jgi:RNA polymerase-associated protein CTR9
VLTEGYLRAGRVSHASDQLDQAKKFYAAAVEGQPRNVVGAIGLAQMQMLTGTRTSFVADVRIYPESQMRYQLLFILSIPSYNNHSQI